MNRRLRAHAISLQMLEHECAVCLTPFFQCRAQRERARKLQQLRDPPGYTVIKVKIDELPVPDDAPLLDLKIGNG